jgi:hypothetical protein
MGLQILGVAARALRARLSVAGRWGCRFRAPRIVRTMLHLAPQQLRADDDDGDRVAPRAEMCVA